MNAIVIEHVPVAELPAAWRAKLAAAAGPTVTVRIEAEAEADAAAAGSSDDLSANAVVGLWRDHEDKADVAAYVRKLREPRYNRDGSRNEP